MERADGTTNGTWQSWFYAAALLLMSFTLIASMTLQVRPGSEVIAVVFPPWWDARQTFLAAASANAAIVRTTAFSSVLVVRPAERDGVARLDAAGAWLTIDPQALAACLTNYSEEIESHD